MTTDSTWRKSLTAFLLISALAATSACVGRSQPDHGPMGSTATGGDADIPDRNSESTPIEKPL
ncbi:MAG: hypothetical protein Q7T44_16040 [Parvibaculum sp.]|nr:hypothetical protein [Parvibaculum sp.]